ncbi:hypothetical protein NQD34_003401 [Periophthalmus magnuspinnatus]|nr:hypothetical protein NQD34_003401 [Periophthalmus magnuspinnatus]
MGWIFGFPLRLLLGEASLDLKPTLYFPGCIAEDGVYVQCAPVKTICMLSTMASILFFSFLASLLFSKGLLPEKIDVFNVKNQQLAPPSGHVGKLADRGDETGLQLETTEPMLKKTKEES